MKTIYFSSCIILVLISLPAVSEAQLVNPLVDSGRKLFEKYCTSCHGLDARGDGSATAALNTKPADLTQIAKRRKGLFPEAEIIAFIDGRSVITAHGSREMPIWGRIFGERAGGGSFGEEIVDGELKALVEYLKSVQK